MATTELYPNALLYIGNKLMSEHASVSIDKKSGLNPVFTVAKGFAGMSRGAPVAEISAEFAVPQHHLDFNPDELMFAGQTIEIAVVIGSKQTVFRGFVTDGTYSHSVNQEAKLSLKFMASFEPFRPLV